MTRKQPATSNQQPSVAIVGPVFPYRAGIAYCTTRLAQELGADVLSFKRQYPRRFYPGESDVDPTLPRFDASFELDILNPLTWLRAGWRLRKYDSVIFVWWVWVWALPYLVMMAFVRGKVILQCHNIGDKEPAAWKRWLTDRVLRRGDALVVHAKTEADDAMRRAPGRNVVRTFLPVHELGGVAPSREEARKILGIEAKRVALFFGHVRPFKGLDIALRAWGMLKTDVLLLVAGEAWWKSEEEYRALASVILSREDGEGPGATQPDASEVLRVAQDDKHIRFDFRFIPDAEIATYFAASDVVLAPYRIEAQSGVALTAFHFARPVIATTVGGLPEIIEEGVNGMLVPPEDPAALARAVDAYFVGHPMDEGARASAARYSWAEYASVVRRLL